MKYINVYIDNDGYKIYHKDLVVNETSSSKLYSKLGLTSFKENYPSIKINLIPTKKVIIKY